VYTWPIWANAITRQPIELDSCSNPLKTREVLQLRFFKNWKILDFCFFVDDVIIGVGFAVFGWCHRALDADPTSRFRGPSLYWKLGYKRVFRALQATHQVARASSNTPSCLHVILVYSGNQARSPGGGGIRRQCSTNFFNSFKFCCAQKKFYAVCFKHVIQTKILPT